MTRWEGGRRELTRSTNPSRGLKPRRTYRQAARFRRHLPRFDVVAWFRGGWR